MSRTITLVREGKSKNRTPKDDRRGPHIRKSAINAAIQLGKTHPRFINGVELMAISDTWRSQETAELLGAKALEITSVLSELRPKLPHDELKAMAAEGKAPEDFLDAGLKVLSNPPLANNWVTHGWKSMGILAAVVEAGGTHNASNILIPNLTVVEFTF